MNATTSAYSSAGGDDNGECKLLGPFAVLVQGALGALALLSLVFKRWRERPQRPLKIWAFDVSKQVFGSVLLHLANLFMAMFSAGEIQAQIAKAAAQVVSETGKKDEDYKPNPCSFYLLNLAIDTTIGIPILFLILKVLTVLASKTPIANPPESIKTGHYGTPPRWSWWLKQSIIYFVGLLGMKVCVFVIFELAPWIVIVGDWALKWTEGNAALQIAFVMLIFPLIMNGLQYYIIDGFIKNKSGGDELPEQSVESGAPDEQGLLAGDEDDHDDDSTSQEEGIKQEARDSATKYHRRTITPYDPIKDGEVEPDVAESSSRSTTSSVRHPAQEERVRL